MPTENRSSNTEMVSVPREPSAQMLDAARNAPVPMVYVDSMRARQDLEFSARYKAAIAQCTQPDPQPHPEPIAWMVGTAIWWTKEEAERDAAATGLPIVGLGPMSGVAPSEQNQGEPYGWAHDDGKEFTTHADHASDLQREGIQMLPLYTHAEPAEVERLRLERRRMDQALSACANERDTLRALLVEALAFLDEAYKHDIGTQLKREIKAFYLSASVEPSAAAESIPEGYCLMPRRLTAENGAKALLLGEFKLEVTRECPECLELDDPAEGCEICDGEGEFAQRHTIPWDQIKFIYSEAVKGLALEPEVAR